jgi:hypothetical protein
MGICSWLKYHERAIVAFGTIIALIISACGIYLAYNPPPKKPNIQRYTNPGGGTLQRDKVSQTLMIYIYNAGQAPCANVQLEYPNIFMETNQIINLENSNLQNAKILNGTIITEPVRQAQIIACNSGDLICIDGYGFVKENQWIMLTFTPDPEKIIHETKIKFTAKCFSQTSSAIFSII